MDTLIIVDSNVWIFAEDASAAEHRIASEAVRELVSTDQYGMNAIIGSEVFHQLARIFDAKAARKRLAVIVGHDAATWLPFSSVTLFKAASLAAAAKMRINDAMIAQQALSLKATVLTDNVKDFRKVSGLKVTALR